MWGLLRIAVALLILAAIVAQASVTFGGAIDAHRDLGTTIVNFFSFFTILSNALSVIVLTVAGVWMLRERGSDAPEPRGLAVVLVSVSTYMIITGIVYNVLLRNIPLPQGTTVGWSNEVLHVVGPAFLLIDVIVRVRHRSLSWGALGVVVAFPIVWSVYTMIRGVLVTNPVTGEPWWYPYPFLNPNITPGGYAGVALYIVGIAVAILLVAGALLRWRRRPAAPRHERELVTGA